MLFAKKNSYLLVLAICSLIVLASKAIFINNQTKLISKRSSSQSDYAFDIVSDISVDFKDQDGNVFIIEAFKSNINEKIITEYSKSYNKLKWYSLGNPVLAWNPFTNNWISFNRNGFYILIETLTNQHRKILKNEIKFKYDIDIEEKQIGYLIGDAVTCHLKIFCSKADKFSSINLIGKAKYLRRFPLRVDFETKKEQLDCLKNELENILSQNETQNELLFECSLSTMSKVSKENSLKIDFNSVQNNDFIDELFGPADSVYVTRKQMANLASNLYSSLKILEEYEINEEKFSYEFIDKILSNIEANKKYEKIPFDDALKSLSKYSIKDIEPDVIRSELGNLFTMDKENNLVIVNKLKDTEINNKSEMGISVKASASYLKKLVDKFFGSLGIDFVKKNGNHWKDKSLDYQLNDLNKETKDHIEWKFDGEKITPKNLNLVQLIKTNFKQKIVFNKIIRRKYEKNFERIFDIEVKKNDVRDLRKLSNYEKSNKNLDKLNEKLDILTDIVYKNSSKQRKLFSLSDNAALIKTLNGHTNSVFALAVLSNGYLASGSADYTIKIWNTNDGSLVRTLNGQTSWVITLAVLPNGYLASGSIDNTIKIWNTNDGSLIRTLNGHKNWVFALAVLPNGYLASGSFDKTINIWNTNDGSLVRTLNGHTDWVRTLTVLPNGYLASGSADKTIKIWNTNDGSLIRTLNGHTDWVRTLTVLPNGNLASGSDDNSINIWNTNDGSLVRTLNGHTSWVRTLTVLPNGYLASGSFDKTINIWNTDDGSLVRTLNGHTGWVRTLTVLPNGYLASGSDDKTIKIWKLFKYL